MFKSENDYNSFLKPGLQGTSAWSSPSNIALVKYWGKKENQIPGNPSLSMSLNESRSITRLDWEVTSEEFSWKFLFEGKPQPSFEPKLNNFFQEVIPLMPFLTRMSLSINSANTFPHSTGIASSASAMSALALCLMDIEMQLTGFKPDLPDYLRKASYMARLGSGSAARSLFPYFSVWGQTDIVPGSSDLYAFPLSVPESSFFSGLQDAILIISSEKKEVSSSKGHDLMKTNPYAPARYKQANENLALLINALHKDSHREFIRIVENEALSLHGLMMGSEPGFILMKHGTLEIIKRIRDFRQDSGLFITFTLDAGPNVHLLYHEKDEEAIRDFVGDELKKFTENGKIIWDGIGDGPEKIS